MRELIYVIAGKEDCLVKAECQKLIDKLLKPEHRLTGLFNFDAAIASASDVFDELRTAPFLTDKRVVIIKRADDFISENRQLLENYFDNPCSTGALILTVNSWPSNTKLAKRLSKVGKLISVSPPKPFQLPQRLVEYANEAHGKQITIDTATFLIELIGEELTFLYSEIDKLAVFVNSENVITAANVESLIGCNRIYGVFEVIDACLAGKVDKSIARLRNMFAEDRSVDYSVVGAFAFHFRRMFYAKAFLEKGNRPDVVAGKLRIWKDKELFFSQVQKMTLGKIGAILQSLAAMDFAIKTGRTKAEVAIEQLVLDSLKPKYEN